MAIEKDAEKTERNLAKTHNILHENKEKKKVEQMRSSLSVGDEITVFVKEINTETRKISLGHKTEDTNPWKILPEKFQEGDTIECYVLEELPRSL